MLKSTGFAIVLLLLLTVSGWAQSPAYMNYQGVARDHDGTVLAMTPISLRISILRGREDGETVYREVHDVTTDRFGMFRLSLGGGEQVTGAFHAIPWSEDQFWVQVELDDNADREYTMLGARQLLSVPYAFYATQAGSLSQPEFTMNRAGVPSMGWHRTGNYGTDPSTDFIGTTDDAALVFRSNNIVRMTLTAAGDLDIVNDVDVEGDLYVEGDATIDGILHLTNTTVSTTKDDGALVVEGGVGVEKELNVGGNADITGRLDVDGVSYINNTTESTTKDNGALVVEGGVGVEKDLNVGGNANIAGMTEFNHLKVSGWPIGEFNNHVAWFENIFDNFSHGIAIKLNKVDTDVGNNFITFYRGNENSDIVAGRIEGYQHKSNAYWNAMSWILPGAAHFLGSINVDLIDYNPNFIDWSSGSLPSLSINFSKMSFSFNKGSLPNVDWSNPTLLKWPPTVTADFSKIKHKLENLICTAYEDDWISLLQTDMISLAMVVSRMEIESECKDGGVTYGSKGADYAEWLPRLNPEEKFIAGQIVGVYGGRISKDTRGADQIMSISMAPVVIGNVPPEEERHLYEKVAFVGQVPIMVRGRVEAGDYIVASGRGDGFGYGISPADLNISHLPNIVGRSLSAAQSLYGDVVTVLIGVRTNEWAEIFRKQDTEIAGLRREVAELRAYANQLSRESSEVEDLRTENAQMQKQLLRIIMAMGLQETENEGRTPVMGALHEK